MVLFIATLASSFALSSGSYVGAERCKSCHPAAYKAWEESAHARAYEGLEDSHQKETRCTICHTLTTDDLAKRFSGVQCETCHGPGKYYSPSYVMKDKELSRLVGLVQPNEQTCKRCHDQNAPNVEPFDYQKAWQRIAHGK
jgi:Cytochrome c554 and c-prime